MKGVTPITVPLTLPMARDAQRALNILFDDCAADEPCRTAFPNLRKEFATVFEKLENGVEVEISDKTDSRKERVRVSRASIAPSIRSILQSVDGAAQLPLLTHQAAAGDFVPLTNAALKIRQGFPKAVSMGMFLAVTSAEDVRISDEKEIARASENTFLRDDYFRQLKEAAKLLPKRELPPNYHEPVRSDIPTLLISGFTDPATPPEGAEEIGRHLPNSRHVVVRYGSHSYGGMSPCVDDMMAAFIEAGNAKNLETSCGDAIRRPPFATSAKTDKPAAD